MLECALQCFQIICVQHVLIVTVKRRANDVRKKFPQPEVLSDSLQNMTHFFWAQFTHYKPQKPCKTFWLAFKASQRRHFYSGYKKVLLAFYVLPCPTWSNCRGKIMIYGTLLHISMPSYCNFTVLDIQEFLVESLLSTSSNQE